ncbi:MAG: transposase [Proteobacteria bacterium]|nr:transposase [Desulfobacterales bacterium]MBL7171749.1 transposase [Desulfobacteraceae bacterium]MBU0733556.1 transposase [Pseudomonadota bacterium]MBU1904426.1 transposase [Pseudomonadota bacterium]
MVQEFDAWFSSEEALADYLRRLRWPDGFRCPACTGSWHALAGYYYLVRLEKDRLTQNLIGPRRGR